MYNSSTLISSNESVAENTESSSLLLQVFEVREQWLVGLSSQVFTLNLQTNI